jgi:4-hydroxy-3-methylbut-2-enyl diphosphate reductase IspH
LEGEALEMLGLREAAIEASLAAVEKARELRALSLELRASTQVHRLSQSTTSLNQLQQVYRRFTEGFDKPDLLAAGEYLNAGASAPMEHVVAR